MSELSKKQQHFVEMVAKLIQWAYSHGYTLSLGEAWRTLEQAAAYASEGKGIANSLHCDRLAIDLNLFKDGVFCVSVEDYRPLGEYWESLSQPGLETAWGGRFKKVDADHFSIKDAGRA